MNHCRIALHKACEDTPPHLLKSRDHRQQAHLKSPLCPLVTVPSSWRSPWLASQTSPKQTEVGCLGCFPPPSPPPLDCLGHCVLRIPAALVQCGQALGHATPGLGIGSCCNRVKCSVSLTPPFQASFVPMAFRLIASA